MLMYKKIFQKNITNKAKQKYIKLKIHIRFVHAFFSKNKTIKNFLGNKTIRKSKKSKVAKIRPHFKDIKKEIFRRFWTKTTFEHSKTFFKKNRWKTLTIPQFLTRKYRRKPINFLFPTVMKYPLRWGNAYARVAYIDFKITYESMNEVIPLQSMPWNTGSKSSFYDNYNSFRLLYFYNEGRLGWFTKNRRMAAMPLYAKPFVPPRYLYFLSTHWTPYYYSMFRLITLWKQQNNTYKQLKNLIKKQQNFKHTKNLFIQKKVKKKSLVTTNFFYSLKKYQSFISTFINEKKVVMKRLKNVPHTNTKQDLHCRLWLKNWLKRFNFLEKTKIMLVWRQKSSHCLVIKKYSGKRKAYNKKKYFLKHGNYFLANFPLHNTALEKKIKAFLHAFNRRNKTKIQLNNLVSTTSSLKKNNLTHYKKIYLNKKTNIIRWNFFANYNNLIQKRIISNKQSNGFSISLLNKKVQTLKKKKVYRNFGTKQHNIFKNLNSFINSQKYKVKLLEKKLLVLKNKKKKSLPHKTKQWRRKKRKPYWYADWFYRYHFLPFLIPGVRFITEKKIPWLLMVHKTINLSHTIVKNTHYKNHKNKFCLTNTSFFSKHKRFINFYNKKIFTIKKQKNRRWQKRFLVSLARTRKNKYQPTFNFLKNKRPRQVYTQKFAKINYPNSFFKLAPWWSEKLQKIQTKREWPYRMTESFKRYRAFFTKFVNKKNFNFKNKLHNNQLQTVNFFKLRQSHRLGSFSLNKKIHFLQLTKQYKWLCKTIPIVRRWQKHYIVYKFDHTQKNPRQYYSISRWDRKSNRWLSPIAHNRKLFWYHLPTKITLQKRHPNRYKSFKIYKWYTKTMSNKWNYGLRAKKNYRLKQIMFGRIILPALDYLEKKQFLFIKKNVARVKPLGLQHSRPAMFLGKFERRLDILTYKLNFAPTIQWARSFVESGLIYVSSLIFIRARNYKHILTKEQKFPLLDEWKLKAYKSGQMIFTDHFLQKKTSVKGRDQWNMPCAITLAAYRVKLKSIVHWSSRNIRTIFFKKLCKRYLPRYFIYNKNKTIAYFWRNMNLIDIDRQKSATRINWNTMKWLM